MFSSLEDFENSRAFWVFFVIAFPLLFMAIWSSVLWMTSHMSGWRRLSKLYRYNNEQVKQWIHRGGGGVYKSGLPFAGMRGRLAVGGAPQGIVIKPPFIIRPFHPTLFLPYEKIQSETDQTLFTLDWVMITMTDLPDIRIGILKSARDMAETVRSA